MTGSKANYFVQNLEDFANRNLLEDSSADLIHKSSEIENGRGKFWGHPAKIQAPTSQQAFSNVMATNVLSNSAQKSIDLANKMNQIKALSALNDQKDQHRAGDKPSGRKPCPQRGGQKDGSKGRVKKEDVKLQTLNLSEHRRAPEGSHRSPESEQKHREDAVPRNQHDVAIAISGRLRSSKKTVQDPKMKPSNLTTLPDHGGFKW